MRRTLKPHSQSQCTAVTHIGVEVSRPSPRRLLLHYFVSCKSGDLLLPPVAAPARADDLWRHTCFEAFVRADAAYYEFNFAPSTQWAAHRFTGYREGMRAAREMETPHFEVQETARSFALKSTLDLRGLTDLPPDAAWRLGLSAVIEEREGRRSYWALSHPPGKPDFHHSDCFALELPAA